MTASEVPAASRGPYAASTGLPAPQRGPARCSSSVRGMALASLFARSTPGTAASAIRANKGLNTALASAHSQPFRPFCDATKGTSIEVAAIHTTTTAMYNRASIVCIVPPPRELLPVARLQAPPRLLLRGRRSAEWVPHEDEVGRCLT